MRPTYIAKKRFIKMNLSMTCLHKPHPTYGLNQPITFWVYLSSYLNVWSYVLQVGSTRSLLDQDFGSIYQHRQLDLQPSTGNFCNDDVSDEEDAKLSLSIGTSTNKRSRTSENSWKNKIMYSPSHDTVDLGESTVTGWNEDAYKFFSLDKSSQSSTDYLNKVVNLQQGLSLYSLISVSFFFNFGKATVLFLELKLKRVIEL